ncbi:Leucine aminopeptidase 1 [Orchesella cincta]|uniref:Leucine aminopeptidase 1 n=1 Tax=Orchesella cincta TaxID=48709 RepID=A0A1D2MCI3_ORCCI|nr:Leucine aminopeptidase 1 [Orchesella cincta]
MASTCTMCKSCPYSYLDEPRYKDLVHRLIAHLDKKRMEATVSKLSGFHSRNAQRKEYSGSSGAEGWLENEIKSTLADYKGGSGSIRLLGDPLLSKPEMKEFPYHQQNILVTLEGQDPSLQSELIILGAHYDSIVGINLDHGEGSAEAAPGADDNGTGVAVLLEVLRLIAKFGIKFKHSVELHWYTAKETEEEGSGDVVKRYCDEDKKVAGMLNLDSLGYQNQTTGTGGRAIAGYVLSYWDEHHHLRTTDRKLTAFVKMLVGEYLQVEYKIRKTENRDVHNSDHYPWYAEGYPSAYVTEFDDNPYRHSTHDLISSVNFEMVNEFAKLGLPFSLSWGS